MKTTGVCWPKGYNGILGGWSIREFCGEGWNEGYAERLVDWFSIGLFLWNQRQDFFGCWDALKELGTGIKVDEDIERANGRRVDWNWLLEGIMVIGLFWFF
ncbi:uncharacterized protein LOC110904666 [Helianthus annuus]|uniref:uncharacterized protein LOC110904666 n=1 Tax=Helianthus annuus TaxID=4232 RepID=UPI000B8FEE6B|nr:uncharacterized protein LOC110904666 [Helianthus annuus]